MTLSLILGAALGVLALPFAVVGAMYWLVFLLRALHGLQASMRAFREEMRAYRLWREEPSPARAPVAPPPDYGPEPVETERRPWQTDRGEEDPAEADRQRRARFRGVPPWDWPAPVPDTGPTAFTEPERPREDYGDAETEPEPLIAAASKLAATPPPPPGP